MNAKISVCVTAFFLIAALGCGKSKLELENENLKAQLEILKQTKEVEAKKESEKKELESKQALEAKKDSERKELEAKKHQLINSGIEKILVRFERLQNEPRNFSSSFSKNSNYKSVNETEESRLKQLANSEAAHIGEVMIELKSAGFLKAEELKAVTEDFISEYNEYVSWDRNWTETAGRPEFSELTAEAKSKRWTAWISLIKASSKVREFKQN